MYNENIKRRLSFRGERNKVIKCLASYVMAVHSTANSLARII